MGDIDGGCSEFKNGVCAKCSVGFYFNDAGKCVVVPATCANFDIPKRVCKACYSGYQLNDKSQCIKAKESEIDPGCNEFKDGVCVKCSFGFYFEANNKCVQIPSDCANFNVNKKQCQACFDGFALNAQFRCVKSDLESVSDAGCSKFEDGLCVTCSQGYYFGANGKCKIIPPTCAKYDTIKEVCQSCYSGYQLNDKSVCVRAEEGNVADAGCNTFKDGVCTKCSFGYYFNQDKKCVQIPVSCARFDTTNRVCLECYSGYKLDNNNKCIESIGDVSDPGCAEFKDNVCTKCSVGFYFNKGNKCKLIPPTCAKFNTAKEMCDSCYPGYGLNGQNQCVERPPESGDSGCSEFQGQVCVKCSDGYYFNKLNVCQLIPVTCKDYDVQNARCRSCYPGYSLDA